GFGSETHVDGRVRDLDRLGFPSDRAHALRSARGQEIRSAIESDFVADVVESVQDHFALRAWLGHGSYCLLAILHPRPAFERRGQGTGPPFGKLPAGARAELTQPRPHVASFVLARLLLCK